MTARLVSIQRNMYVCMYIYNGCLKTIDSYAVLGMSTKNANRACRTPSGSVYKLKILKHVTTEHNQKQSDICCILIRVIHEKATKDMLIMIMPIITFCSEGQREQH